MKRYNVQACATGDQPGAYLDTEEAPDGEWVKWEDVAAVIARLERALSYAEREIVSISPEDPDPIVDLRNVIESLKKE